MTSKVEENSAKSNRIPLKDSWAIRPCEVYYEEYSDCTSIKARFHQYFIYGETVDCSQWRTDYDNCVQYRDSDEKNVTAGEAVIRSEEERRRKRMGAHFANTTWKKRDNPPEDWSKPLPEWLLKKNENTYLEIKANELAEGISAESSKSYCSIM